MLFRTDVRDMPLIGLEQETFRTREAEKRKGRGFISTLGIHAPGGDTAPVPAERPDVPVHPDWDSNIRSIAEACRAAGARLVIRFGPIEARFLGARDWSQLERWADTLDGVTVSKPLIVAYPHELMWDSIHLNAAGVAKFMPIVAKDVQAALAERRDASTPSPATPIANR